MKPSAISNTAKRDFIYILILTIVSSIVLTRFEIFDWLYHWSRAHEDLNVDELFIVTFVLTVAFMIFSYRRYSELKAESEARNKVEISLADSERELEIISRLELAREEERSKISREIHDQFGQVLTYLKLNLSWLNKNFSQPLSVAHTQQKLGNLLELTDSMIEMVREISGQLRPVILENLGFILAVEDELEKLRKASGIQYEFSKSSDIKLEGEKSLMLFRIIQESFSNIARHAHANKVKVQMEMKGEYLNIQIQDDGVGMEPDKINTSRSLGMAGMRDRIRFLKGEMNIVSSPMKGMQLHIKIPCPTPSK